MFANKEIRHGTVQIEFGPSTKSAQVPSPNSLEMSARVKPTKEKMWASRDQIALRRDVRRDSLGRVERAAARRHCAGAGIERRRGT
jgi:hypothetical protein